MVKYERGVKFMGKENKLLFIYNPHSGKEQIKHKLAEILDVFAKHGMELTVHHVRVCQGCL